MAEENRPIKGWFYPQGGGREVPIYGEPEPPATQPSNLTFVPGQQAPLESTHISQTSYSTTVPISVSQQALQESIKQPTTTIVTPIGESGQPQSGGKIIGYEDPNKQQSVLLEKPIYVNPYTGDWTSIQPTPQQAFQNLASAPIQPTTSEDIKVATQQAQQQAQIDYSLSQDYMRQAAFQADQPLQRGMFLVTHPLLPFEEAIGAGLQSIFLQKPPSETFQKSAEEYGQARTSWTYETMATSQLDRRWLAMKEMIEPASLVLGAKILPPLLKTVAGSKIGAGIITVAGLGLTGYGIFGTTSELLKPYEEQKASTIGIGALQVIGGAALTFTGMKGLGIPSLLQWKNEPSISTTDSMGMNILTPKRISIAAGTEEVGSDVTQTLKLFGKISTGFTRVSSFSGDLEYGAMGTDVIPSAAKGFGITQYKYEFLGQAFKYGWEAPYIETTGFQWMQGISKGITSITTQGYLGAGKISFPLSGIGGQEAFGISQTQIYSGQKIGFGYSISKVTPTLLGEKILDVGDKNVMDKISVMSSEGRAGTISSLKSSGKEWKPFGEENPAYQAVQKQFSLEGQIFKISGRQFKEFASLKDKTFGESLLGKVPSGSISGKANILSIEPIMISGSAGGSATTAPLKFGSEFFGGLGGATFIDSIVKLPKTMETTAKITSTSLWIPFNSKSISSISDINIMRYPSGEANIITTTLKNIQPHNMNQLQKQLLGQSQLQNQITSQITNIGLKNIQNIGEFTSQGTIQNIEQGQMQKQLQQLTTVTSMTDIVTHPIPTPSIVTHPIPTPSIVTHPIPTPPSFGLPNFGFDERKFNIKMGKLNLKTKYNPSLMAIGERIFSRGKTPKLVSGFGIRPIMLSKKGRIKL